MVAGHRDLAREAIYQMPVEAVLWNSLGDGLCRRRPCRRKRAILSGGHPPRSAVRRPYHNIGYAYSHLGLLKESLEA